MSKATTKVAKRKEKQPKQSTKDKEPLQEEIKSDEEWQEVEVLIERYQAQFSAPSKIDDAKKAIDELLERFYPLFKKYLVLIKSGQINFNDTEMKHFVYTFMVESSLKAALKRKHITAAARAPIYQRFNFVKETYGTLSEEEIMGDLQMLFVTLAKRYKQIGKSFCGYLYNCYYHEVSRHIKKFTSNVGNIPYKNSEYEEFMQKSIDEFQKEDIPFEERLFETPEGIPDTSWTNGETCSDIFDNDKLTTIERKILVMYYLEDYNDRQIADVLGLHINTVNQKRRCAAEIVAQTLGVDKSRIKRNRKSGKHLLMRL